MELLFLFGIALLFATSVTLGTGLRFFAKSCANRIFTIYNTPVF